MSTDLIYSIGDIFTWTFGILTSLGNLPNVAFITLGFIGLAAWLWRQNKYNKEDGAAGRLV